MADRNKPEMGEKARKNSENQRKRSSSEFRNVEVEVGNVEVLEDPFENAAAAPPCSRNSSTTPSDEKSFREKLKRAAFLNYGCEVEELSAETFQKLLHTVTAEVRDVRQCFWIRHIVQNMYMTSFAVILLSSIVKSRKVRSRKYSQRIGTQYNYL